MSVSNLRLRYALWAVLRAFVLGPSLLIFVCRLEISPGGAQNPGCKITAYTAPPREVLTCPDGLTLTAEKDSAYRLLDRDDDGRPEAVELTKKGLLIESPRTNVDHEFQILTPHAIASVRGSVWAIDVQPSRTSVFVRAGVVSVSPGGDAKAVMLEGGEGVDVEPGKSLKVRQWGAERVARLMARFGR